jgi:hypothetical protein
MKMADFKWILLNVHFKDTVGPLNVIRDNVICRLLLSKSSLSRFTSPKSPFITSSFAYSYHLDTVIWLTLAQSDHIKWLPIYLIKLWRKIQRTFQNAFQRFLIFRVKLNFPNANFCVTSGRQHPISVDAHVHDAFTVIEDEACVRFKRNPVDVRIKPNPVDGGIEPNTFGLRIKPNPVSIRFGCNPFGVIFVRKSICVIGLWDDLQLTHSSVARRR